MKGSPTNLVCRLLLLAALASPAASQVVELDVQFDGDDAQSWASALMLDEEAAIPRLAAGGASALPMLRALLADERKGVQEGVAMVCERIGAPALPLGPALLAQLRDSEIYTTRVQAARALAAIGDRRPEVVDALLEAVFAAETDEVFLRITRYGDHLRPFAAALQSLDAAATARVLKAIDANQAASTGHAARVLDLLDDTAVPMLIAALDAEQRATGETARVAAQESLLHRGWRVARRLERAGHPALAERALHAGALRGIDWVELYAITEHATAPLTRLPDMRWQRATTRDDTLTLWRGAERPQGFFVERLLVTVPKRGEPTVTATSTVVPRALANDAMRAVSKVLSSTLTLRERLITGITVDESCMSMHASDGEQTLLDETFVGSPSSDNLPQRFPLEATTRVLDDLLHDAVWRPREIADADRQQLRAALARDDSPAWLQRRLHALADALGVEHR